MMRSIMRCGVGLIGGLWLMGILAAHCEDPLQQPITLDQPAQSVKQLLTTLSQQTGVQLFAPSPIDSEIVLVSVKAMSLKELMDALAQVTDGEWLQQPNGSYRLVRTPRIITLRQQQDNEQILQKLKSLVGRKEFAQWTEPLTEAQARQHRDKIKQLMREAESLDTPRLWDAHSRQSMEQSAQALDAGRRLTLRLLKQLDLRRLLDIPVGERRVFSNMRGRYLLPFGFAVQPLLEQYAREKRLVYEVWTHPTEGLDAQAVERFNNRFGYFIPDYSLRQELPDSPLTRVYLAVDRVAPDDFYFSVRLLTEDMGTEIHAGFIVLYEIQFRLTNLENAKTEPSKMSNEKVEWSQPSRQLIEAYRAMERATEPVPWPAILDPVQTEPLALIPSDVLRTYARQKGKNVIALLPDNLGSWISYATVWGDDLRTYISALDWSHQRQETERVILIKPRSSSYQWGSRIDRKALSELIKSILQQGYIRLEHWFALMKLCDSPQRDTELIQAYLRPILSDVSDLRDLSRSSFRLIRSLTPAQVQELLSGGTLMLSKLTAHQREQLIKDIYYSDSQLERDVDWVVQQSAESGEFTRLSNLPATDLVHAVYPDGLPTKLVLKCAAREEKLGVFTQRRAGVWSNFREAFQLVFEMMTVEDTPGVSIDESIRDYFRQQVEQYKNALLMPAAQKPFQIEVAVPPFRIRLPSERAYTYYIRGFADYRLLNDGKPVTLDQLPPELKKQLEEYRAHFRPLPGR
jgi:hypothetical protein